MSEYAHEFFCDWLERRAVSTGKMLRYFTPSFGDIWVELEEDMWPCASCAAWITWASYEQPGDANFVTGRGLVCPVCQHVQTDKPSRVRDVERLCDR